MSEVGLQYNSSNNDTFNNFISRSAEVDFELEETNSDNPLMLLGLRFPNSGSLNFADAVVSAQLLANSQSIASPANRADVPQKKIVSINWNQVTCRAHRLQLSARLFLLPAEYQQSVKRYSKNSCYFFRSSIASIFLQKSFKSSKKFKCSLWPILDVKTRWTISLHMMKRYLRIEDIMYDAHYAMVNAKTNINGRKAGGYLDAVINALFESTVHLLQHVNNRSMIVSRADEPTMQNVDPLTAGIVLRLDNVDDDSELKPLDVQFKEGILNRQNELFQAQPMFDLCVQTASFLNPAHKSMGHSKILGGFGAYRKIIEDCLFVLDNVSSALENPEKHTSTVSRLGFSREKNQKSNCKERQTNII